MTQTGVMAAASALALFTMTVLVISGGASNTLQTGGVVALRAVLLLFPPAAKNALALLNCVSATVSPSGCASLNGCSGGGGGGRDSTVSVRLLASNPFYVCWASGGTHTAAGGLAAATLIVVVIAFPLASLWAVFRWTRQSRARCLLASRSDERHRGTSKEAAVAIVNPMRQLGVASALSPATVQATAAIAAPGKASAPSPFLAPFLSDYRPEACYTRHADLALSLLLAALQVGG